jgi:hypothetical protein
MTAAAAVTERWAGTTRAPRPARSSKADGPVGDVIVACPGYALSSFDAGEKVPEPFQRSLNDFKS